MLGFNLKWEKSFLVEGKFKTLENDISVEQHKCKLAEVNIADQNECVEFYTRSAEVSFFLIIAFKASNQTKKAILCIFFRVQFCLRSIFQSLHYFLTYL